MQCTKSFFCLSWYDMCVPLLPAALDVIPLHRQPPAPLPPAGPYAGTRQEQPFTFDAFDRPVPWRRLNAIDIDSAIAGNDASSAAELIDVLAHADLGR